MLLFENEIYQSMTSYLMHTHSFIHDLDLTMDMDEELLGKTIILANKVEIIFLIVLLFLFL